jgi:6-phosphogluconate dehydrogenase
MELGMIGLGKMGANMTQRLLKKGHRVVAYARTAATVQSIVEKGAEGSSSLGDLVSKLKTPRTIWVMVPSGVATENTILDLMKLLSKGDTIIDGGNSNYKDSQRRAKLIEEAGFHFLDVGTSGGIWGLVEGYSLMIGGEAEVVEAHRALFDSLAPAPDKGWGRVGPWGAGHFVKMIHNGIEYGMMEALAEGFEILDTKKEFNLNLHQVSQIWQYGSVVRSWLLDLAERALEDDPELSDIQGWVEDSGEGRWTVTEAIDLNVSAPIITLALQRRLRSRQDDPFAERMLAALRNQFGGHSFKTKED